MCKNGLCGYAAAGMSEKNAELFAQGVEDVFLIDFEYVPLLILS